MWKRHWRIKGDPFLGPGAPYVPTSGHDEAVARLTSAIESGERLAVLRAGPGLGKSAVLARAVAESRAPRRRFARVHAPVDGPAMLAALAAGLGVPVATGAGRPAAWKALADAVRLCHWQKIHPILVIDDRHLLTEPADRRDLERLTHLTPNPAAWLTVLHAVCESDDDEPPPAWQVVIRLIPLLRSETSRYVDAKLAAAGRTDPAFTPEALRRLHDLSGGVPLGIDRLGSLSLMAGALGGLEQVTPDIVDGVARECTLRWPEYAA